MTGRTIEDLVIGDRAELTCSLNAELVANFVTISGDRNPLHRDAEFAASTSFGEPIAPGILTAALISAVIGTELPGPGAVYLSQTLKFLRPVKLSDTITARVEVAEIIGYEDIGGLGAQIETIKDAVELPYLYAH
jgi:3-hydroxybutyryl-CoA dehydratase